MCACSATGRDVSSQSSSNSFAKELQLRAEKLRRKAKVVRFEDYLDTSARGQTGAMRRQFRTEDQKSRVKKEVRRFQFWVSIDDRRLEFSCCSQMLVFQMCYIRFNCKFCCNLSRDYCRLCLIFFFKALDLLHRLVCFIDFCSFWVTCTRMNYKILLIDLNQN